MTLYDLTATELAGLLQSRRVSATEVARACLERAEEWEPTLHAFLHLDPADILRRAREADARLATGQAPALCGIPVAIKDNLCVPGQPATCGSKMLEHFIPPYAATVIERLQDQGAVIFGKTNLDEFAMGSSTENSAFGPTRNPWDPKRVPGGSSGGSAAAVAAGLAPLALGSDTGGSIRQPAAFCGVSGLKPTYGRVSRYGLVAFASSLDQIGPLARDARDLALLMQAISGHDPRDSTSADLAVPDFSLAQTPQRVSATLGIPRECFGPGLDARVKEKVMDAARDLESLGYRLEEVSLPHLEYALPAYYIIAPAEASSNLARYDGARYGYRSSQGQDVEEMSSHTRREGFGPEVRRRIMIGTYALSAGYYDAYYLKAQKVRTLIKGDFDRAFGSCDLLLMPATPTPAFGLGEKAQDPLEMYLSDIYTVAINLAGLPGLALPCGFADALPLGLQLIGRPFREDALLQAAHHYQQHTSFHRERPVLAKGAGKEI